jgi:hypothetical protein
MRAVMEAVDRVLCPFSDSIVLRVKNQRLNCSGIGIGITLFDVMIGIYDKMQGVYHVVAMGA